MSFSEIVKTFFSLSQFLLFQLPYFKLNFMNIFIGNLNFQTTEEQLNDLFSSYGEVASVKIITDKFSNRSKGFGFVEMPDQTEAENAIENLNDYTLDSRSIVVNESKPKEEARPRARRY